MTTRSANAGRPSVLGLHHVTLAAANAQRTVDFYSRVLGLRLVKSTVNFDDPGSYHLYFADETGKPGTVITFFEWPRAPRGQSGIGGLHHISLRVATPDALRRWARRLADRGVAMSGPFVRGSSLSIELRDPDGVLLEIAAARNGANGANGAPSSDPAVWPEPVDVIDSDMSLLGGMHRLTAVTSNLEVTHQFLGEILGMHRVTEEDGVDQAGRRNWTWSAEQASTSMVTYIERDIRTERRARMGTGQGHHYALAVADDVAQHAFRERLREAGLSVSPVMDRVYFKSIYTQDPDGHIVELATMGPGFLIDEPVTSTGTGLMLPPWLEGHREDIERHLTPIERMPWFTPAVVSPLNGRAA